jgi:hypothetical protein
MLCITTAPVNNINISTGDKAAVNINANNIIKTKKPATSKLITLRNLNNPNFADMCTLFIFTNLAKITRRSTGHQIFLPGNRQFIK